MRVRHTVLWFAILATLSIASADASNDRLRIEESPMMSLAQSGAYYRSSMVPLDGVNAAAITEMTFKNLPGGDYDVMVVLVEADGRRTADRRQITVTSMGR